jgi:hypothetical protein
MADGRRNSRGGEKAQSGVSTYGFYSMMSDGELKAAVRSCFNSDDAD